MRLVTHVLFALLVALPLAAQSDSIERARAALDRDDPDTAARLLQSDIGRSPQNAEEHYLLGVAYGKQAEKANIFRQASLARGTRDEFERAVELDPDHLDARFSLLQYYTLAPNILGGSIEKAFAQAEEIARREPVYGHRARAYIYGIKKNYRQADAELEAALAIEPDDPTTLYELGHLAALSGIDLKQGEEALQRYLTLSLHRNDPSPAQALDWLSKIYEREGRAAEAQRASYQARHMQASRKTADYVP